MVSIDLWLCWFVGLHGGADFGSFAVVLVMIFYGGVRCG